MMKNKFFIFLAVIIASAMFCANSMAATTLVSAGNQSWSVGQPAAPMLQLTITEDGATPVVTAANDCRIRIPTAFNCTWDTTDTTPAFTGTASGKVSATVTYQDSGKTMLIWVNSSFAASDTLIINGQSFTAFTAVSASSNLGMDIDNNGVADYTDSATIEITAGVYTNTPTQAPTYTPTATPVPATATLTPTLTPTVAATATMTPTPTNTATAVYSAIPGVCTDGRIGGTTYNLGCNDTVDRPYLMRLPNWAAPYGSVADGGTMYYDTVTSELVFAGNHEGWKVLACYTATATPYPTVIPGSPTYTPTTAPTATPTVTVTPFSITTGGSISGGVVNLNASSNYATNINTGTTTAAVNIGSANAGAIGITSGSTVGVSGLDDVTICVTSGTAGEDLLITQTGANDSSITLSAAGTGTDAIGIQATAGGVDIDGGAASSFITSAGDITVQATAASVNLNANEAAADQIKLSAQGTIAGDAINLVTTDGGIKLNAVGAANGDVGITAGDDVKITTTGDTLVGDGGVTNYTKIDATGAITQAGSATLTLQDGSDLIISANPNASPFVATTGDAMTGALSVTGDITVPETIGGNNAGEKNTISGVLLTKQYCLGTGTNGATETTLYVDNDPTGEWSAVDGDCTVSQSSDPAKEGKSLGLAFLVTAAAGDGAVRVIAGDDLEANESIGGWIRSTEVLSAGDLTVVITDDGGDRTFNIPAVATADKWTWFEIDISALDGGTGDNCTGVKILLSAAGEAAHGAFTVYVDNLVKWDATDEEALGGKVVMDGVVSVIGSATAGWTTPTNLDEWTSWFVNYESGSDYLVWMDDQSARSNIAQVCYSE